MAFGPRRVVWSEFAARSLEEIVRHIARERPGVARRFARKAVAAAESLRRFPERGRVVPEAPRGDVREIFVHSYRLMYRTRDDHVQILAFVHGARDHRRRVREADP